MARGSIRPRGKAWEIRVYAGRDPITGKERHRSRTVKGTKRQAERALTALLAELDQGAHQGPDATVVTLLDRWQAARSPDWTPKTRAETERFAARLAGLLSDVQLRDLTAEQIDTAYGRLRAEGLSAASVRRHHDVLHAALAQAVRWRWLTWNPSDDARPRATRHVIEPPTDAELDRLLEYVAGADPVYGLLLVLAAETGWRRGELVALRWSDLDLDAGTLRPRRRVSAGVEVPGTKGGGDRTSVTLSPAAATALRGHRARAAVLALECGTPLPDGAHLFTFDPDGARPWRADYVTARFIRARGQVGLDHVRFHDLRHYVATTLLAAGVDVGTVADRLGHTLASTTLNIYRAHVPAADQRAAEILAARRQAR